MLGCESFGIEAFEVGTSSALLATVLIWDLHSGTESSAHPSNPLKSPIELFQQNAIHGGTWRTAFRTNGYTEVSAVLYMLGQARPWILTAIAAKLALNYNRSRARL